MYSLPLFQGYRVLNQLAAGQIASVWSARCFVSGQLVAIKQAGHAAPNSLRSEAQFLRRLKHPQIVSFVAYQASEPAYLVMTNPGGSSVDQMLGNRQLISVGQAVSVVQAVLTALDYLHNRGIAHADIKPSNIVLNVDGSPLLVDFGSAIALDQPLAGSPQRICSVTPSIMAPELIQGHPPSIQTDLFAVGVLLYELLCGIKPFVGDSVWATQRHILAGDWQAVQTHRADLADCFDHVLRNALAVSPKMRYRSAPELTVSLSLGMAYFRNMNRKLLTKRSV